MESNQEALAIVDRQFQVLSDRIDALDLLSDKLQASKERLADIDKEIGQVKTDADSLERSKRISRLTSLNSSKELAAADDSAIVAKIVIAKGKVLDAGRTVRNLIGSVLFQLSQTRKLNATLMLERELVIRKVPVRLSDLANAARGVVQVKEIEELLTRPLRNQAEELSALYVLKTKFAPIREACLSETNLVLEIRNPEEPAVAEPAAELALA
jgi:hypothetical protein